MNITLITLMPEMLSALNYGVIGKAIDDGIINITTINPRAFTQDVHHSVDDRPYGGGPGMVMSYPPLKKAILSARSNHPSNTPVIYLSPQGKPLRQSQVTDLSAKKDLILLAGRYEGIDERIIEHHVDEEISIGDYIVSGGDLPAMVLIDAITRLLPGALGAEASHQQDSFSETLLLDHPHYTRPESIDDYSVPSVLLSGNHEAIATWRQKHSLGNTWQKRPDLLKRRLLMKKEQELLDDFQKEIENS